MPPRPDDDEKQWRIDPSSGDDELAREIANIPDLTLPENQSKYKRLEALMRMETSYFHPVQHAERMFVLCNRFRIMMKEDPEQGERFFFNKVVFWLGVTDEGDNHPTFVKDAIWHIRFRSTPREERATLFGEA
jgi:hypothetical protein